MRQRHNMTEFPTTNLELEMGGPGSITCPDSILSVLLYFHLDSSHPTTLTALHPRLWHVHLPLEANGSRLSFPLLRVHPFARHYVLLRKFGLPPQQIWQPLEGVG